MGLLDKLFKKPPIVRVQIVNTKGELTEMNWELEGEVAETEEAVWVAEIAKGAPEVKMIRFLGKRNGRPDFSGQWHQLR